MVHGVPGRHADHRQAPSALDELVLDVTDILEDAEIDYAVVSGYVPVLLGRSRATEDIDVLAEPFSETKADELVDALRDAGYWGSALPLDRIAYKLDTGAEKDFEDALHLHEMPSQNLNAGKSKITSRNWVWKTSMTNSDEREAKHARSRRERYERIKSGRSTCGRIPTRTGATR